jgi:23S rRNA pseudouridine1911/1915/1917 synthase
MISTQNIVFEDEYLLALNKPAGVVVNKAETVKGETLQDWIETQYSQCFSDQALKLSTDEDKDTFLKRNGMVHRLDKDTSGIILWAKNPESMFGLMAQFKERTTQKTYTALVHGKIKNIRGTVKVPLGRTSRDRKKFGVVMGGKMSVTDYRVLHTYSSSHPKYTAGFSLVELSPRTGRTHQLRVVLKHLGHPIVGDSTYVGRKRAKYDAQWCPRQFLHAASIRFEHPATHQKQTCQADLATDLAMVLEQLQLEETYEV